MLHEFLKINNNFNGSYGKKKKVFEKVFLTAYQNFKMIFKFVFRLDDDQLLMRRWP